MKFFTTPSSLLGLFIVVFSILVAVAGVFIIRRRVKYSALVEDNEATGFVYSMIGIVYAVLLAFVVIVVWEQYNDTQNNVQEEAIRVSNLLRDAQVFPASTQKELQKRLVAYAKAVVKDEWETMSRGQPSSVASEAYERVWEVYYKVQPETERERVFYTESIKRLNDLAGNRRLRLLSSQPGLPPLLWILLIGGGIITIACTYLFGTKNVWTQMLLLASLAGGIGFSLFLILALDFPFSGDMRISPEALESVIQIWEPRIGK